MKVALIIDTWFPAVGGGQINALEISQRLAKKGVNFEVITRNCGKNNLALASGIKVYNLGPETNPDNQISKIIFLFRVFFFLFKKKYDLIHVHPFLPTLAAKLISILKDTPIIITVHGTRLFEKNYYNSPSIILEKIILTKIKYDTQISVTNAFKKIKNVNSKIIVIPNGITQSEINSIKIKKASYPKILWVGRFDPVKNVDALIKAMPKIINKFKNAKLVLVGYGYEQEKLKEITKKLEMTRNVIFKGKLSHQDLIKEYKSSHLFVLPSSSEGQPISIIEAISLGIPVIATNVGGIPELIKDKVNGILLGSASIEELSDAIVDVLNKKYKLNKIKLNPSFSWDTIATKTKKVYQSVQS